FQNLEVVPYIAHSAILRNNCIKPLIPSLISIFFFGRCIEDFKTFTGRLDFLILEELKNLLNKENEDLAALS
ncbi:hypothetical protein ACJX0J_036625, partial [Zea mays]